VVNGADEDNLKKLGLYIIFKDAIANAQSNKEFGMEPSGIDKLYLDVIDMHNSYLETKENSPEEADDQLGVLIGLLDDTPLITFCYDRMKRFEFESRYEEVLSSSNITRLSKERIKWLDDESDDQEVELIEQEVKGTDKTFYWANIISKSNRTKHYLDAIDKGDRTQLFESALIIVGYLFTDNYKSKKHHKSPIEKINFHEEIHPEVYKARTRLGDNHRVFIMEYGTNTRTNDSGDKIEVPVFLIVAACIHKDQGTVIRNLLGGLYN